VDGRLAAVAAAYRISMLKAEVAAKVVCATSNESFLI